MAFRSGNPALNSNAFLEEAEKALAKRRGMPGGPVLDSSPTGEPSYGVPGSAPSRDISGVESYDVMTLDGTVRASFALLFFLIAGFAVTWYLLAQGMMAATVLIPIGLIGGFCVALFTIFKKAYAPISSPFYAALEGVALGGISFFYETQYHGIVLQSAGLTIAILAALLLAYTTRLIKPSENFKLGVFAATGGIALMYLANFVMSMFHMPFGFLSDSGPMGIGISAVIVIIASLNLVIDFDFIETGVEAKAPKYMEWYGAFGLLVTLVWLYLEILRLMAKLSSKRN